MKTGCVILAAGAGRRMGGKNKAMLRWQGKTFLERIENGLQALGDVECVVVVAEPHASETEREAKRLGYPCIRNPEPERGMGSSVAIGFSYASKNFAAKVCWLWPVDAPGVDIGTLRELRDLAEVGKILTPSFGGRGGHPTLVGRDVWGELEACESELAGARSVFRRDPSRRHFVEVSDPTVRHDIDEPTDLEALS